MASPRCSRAYVSRVVERQLVQVDLLAARLLDQPHGVVQQRQRAQAEEVHLEHADLLQVAHDPLRRDHRLVALAAAVVALADDALQRHVIGQRAVGDDDAGGVRAGVAVGPFQLAGDVDQLADLRVAVVLALQVGALLERRRRA